MGSVEGREPTLGTLGRPLTVSITEARRERAPGQLIPPQELALADFARHLSLSARKRTAGAYLDTLQRLLAFGLDPLLADRSDLERFLARGRRGRWGDWEGPLSSSTQTPELAALHRSGWRFSSTPKRPAWSGERKRRSSPAAGETNRWTASTSASSCARPLSWPGSRWSGPCTRCGTATPGPCAGWRPRWRRSRRR